MKAFSLRFIAVWVLLCPTCIAFSATAEGAIPGFPSWGSTNSIKNYCVTNIQELWIDIWSSNSVHMGSATDGGLVFTNKEALDALFSKELIGAANGAVTNTYPTVNKSQPFKVVAVAVRHDPIHNLDHAYFSVPGSLFTLINSNGVYSLPDLSGITLTFSLRTPFYVSNLKWARMETYLKGNGVDSNSFGLYDVRDPRLSSDPSTTGIFPDQEMLFITTTYLTSGTNGQYRLKVSIVSGTNNVFQVFNGLGQLVPETPIVIKQFSITNSMMKFSVTGGDSGRMFVVESSTNMLTWIPASVTNTIDIAGDSTPFQEALVSGLRKFYRVRTVNGVPGL
jgi:hypothetical protein